jgi:periplasmic copper chaperone A
MTDMTARQYGLSACALAILLLFAALFSGAVQAAAEKPHVMGAWVRLPAVSSRPAGGFFMVHGTAKADALMGVTSTKAQRIEMHSMVEENGVMRMRAEKSFAVPAGGTLNFQSGGNHLMIFGLSPDVKPGSKIPLVFSFQSGAKVTVDAGAQAASAPTPEPAHKH